MSRSNFSFFQADSNRSRLGVEGREKLRLEMTQVSILGFGIWGTALGNHLAAQGYAVTAWSTNEEVVRSVNETKRNAVYAPQVALHSGIRLSGNLEECATQDVVVLCVPSDGVAELLEKLHVPAESIVVSAIKGLDPATCLTPLQLAAKIGVGTEKLCVLSGPSFAKDVIASRPCGVVAAAADERVAWKIAELFTNETMRVYVSNDPIGVEIGGIVKNIIALAVGVSDGLEFGDSARAGLITRGLAEMTRLGKAMGANTHTFMGLSGLGDLVMSASCDTSRNRTVGMHLGRGEKISDILSSLGLTAEGVTSTPRVVELARKYGVEMPITELAHRFLSGNVDRAELMKSLLSRPVKKEIDD